VDTPRDVVDNQSEQTDGTTTKPYSSKSVVEPTQGPSYLQVVIPEKKLKVGDTNSARSGACGGGGPRTPRGKTRSKSNATKHGIFSGVILLKQESKSDYKVLSN
jgi:hypothetical protein